MDAVLKIFAFGMELTILLGIIFMIALYRVNKRPKNFPKGPLVFPILGTLPQIMWNKAVNKKSKHLLLTEYAKQYGDVYAINLASYRVVVINDYKLIKEAWNDYQLCGRPKLHGAAARTGGVVRGIILQDGAEWVEQRRFALRHLRDFGFGKKSMESLVMDEAQDLIEGFKKDAGEPISTQNRFNVAVLNSLWMIVAGKRFTHDDPELKEILDSVSRMMQSQGLGFYISWIKDVAPKLSGWDKYIKELPGQTRFITKFVTDRLKTFQGGQPEHFTDVYINEIKKTTDPNSSFYKERGEATLIATLLDLFLAGAETTSTTLTYTFLYLALFPEKQKKVHEEIDRVLGSRYPTLEDRSRMPYTEAVIMETLRFSAMVPNGIIHKALADVHFHGYFIPKDTWIIPNLHAVHHNPEIWGDPQNFRPERFLNQDETETVRHEALLAFSYGKRVCLGETLAKDELFLFVSSLFQQFQVGTDPSSPTPSIEQIGSLIISIPKPHNLVMKLRKKE